MTKTIAPTTDSASRGLTSGRSRLLEGALATTLAIEVRVLGATLAQAVHLGGSDSRRR